MKLRLRGNTLRFRLTRSEVAQFGEDGYIEGSTRFSAGKSGRWVYALRAMAAPLGGVDIRFSPDRLEVLVPSQLAEEWCQTEKVGFDARVSLEEGQSLDVLVEKDFSCSHSSQEEEQSDRYPHPDQKKS